MLRRWVVWMPLGLLLLMLLLFAHRLLTHDAGNTAINSPLMGQAVPAFSLPSLTQQPITQQWFEQWANQPVLLNVWASWCPGCLEEHAFLSQLSEQGVVIIGLNYKDDPKQAQRWLQQHGNPFAEIIVDRSGTLALDLGVYGAPETYVIQAGVIQAKYVGVLSQTQWNETFASFFE